MEEASPQNDNVEKFAQMDNILLDTSNEVTLCRLLEYPNIPYFIFSYLDVQTLCRLEYTCKQFSSLLDEHGWLAKKLWSDLCVKHFNDREPTDLNNDPKQFKQVYSNRWRNSARKRASDGKESWMKRLKLTKQTSKQFSESLQNMETT